MSLDSSPISSAEEAIRKMRIADGFKVQLVASEPLVQTPVALTFDAMGRMWVVELTGYMPDTTGRGEEYKKGKVVILEDTNKDGIMDNRKVFLDSLVMPRGVCLVENGALIAEPPNLWFYEIGNDDKPSKKILVDDKYAEGGNVQHQSNGLLRNLDNWIYNAKSAKRYRKRADKWLVEHTHFRGQWGITQDNNGRLFYNTNSDNILGDYFAPGFGANNKYQRAVEGFNVKIVPDTRVYPARPTPGVNRGYMNGILDDSLRLINFTAACGPVIYRGDLFGSEYELNAFLAEPAANLVKRNILKEKGFVMQGSQAYEGKEFLASTDERFRPVHVYNGPDGALYMVDMYRGILDHVTYMTTYLKNEIGRRKLTLPLDCGRIYKIVPTQKKSRWVALTNDPRILVSMLNHQNGWVRDKAQQILIDGKFGEAIPALRKAVNESRNQLEIIHALWTLEGLDALKPDDVLPLLRRPSWKIRMQALSVLPSIINKRNYKEIFTGLEQLILENDTLSAPYIAFLANDLYPYDKVAARNVLLRLVKRFPANKYVVDAVISSSQNRELILQRDVFAFLPDSNQIIQKRLKELIAVKTAKAYLNPTALKKQFPKGAALYTSSCQPCHGADGNGIRLLAPPLNQSQWVTGNKDKLISIVLFGLTGPVNVNDHLYRAPEINGDMPGIGYDTKVSNEDLAQLLSFIRKSWRNEAGNITAEEVERIRVNLKSRQKAFTIDELNTLF